MANTDDARDHLTVVRQFIDGSPPAEERRITRDLSARVDPVDFTQVAGQVRTRLGLGERR